MSIEIKPVDLSDPSIQKVIEALREGKKLKAIMHYRNAHDVSLIESQKEVERIAAKLEL
jgi:hypothetical protein